MWRRSHLPVAVAVPAGEGQDGTASVVPAAAQPATPAQAPARRLKRPVKDRPPDPVFSCELIIGCRKGEIGPSGARAIGRSGKRNRTAMTRFLQPILLISSGNGSPSAQTAPSSKNSFL